MRVCIKSKMHHFTKAYLLKSNLTSMRLIVIWTWWFIQWDNHEKRCRNVNHFNGNETMKWLNFSPGVYFFVCVLLWAVVAIAHIIYVIALLIIVQAIAHRILSRWHDWCWSSRWWWMHWKWRCTGCLFGCIHICFFLSFANIFLVPNALVTEPIANLRDLKEMWKCRLMYL